MTHRSIRQGFEIGDGCLFQARFGGETARHMTATLMCAADAKNPRTMLLAAALPYMYFKWKKWEPRYHRAGNSHPHEVKKVAAPRWISA